MANYLNHIILLPFLSSMILGISYLIDTQKRLPQIYYTFIAILSPSIVTVLSLSLGVELALHDENYTLITNVYSWINIGDFKIELSFMADRLSVVMIAFVSFVGTLIHVYSIGYMKDDLGYGKFFAYFNLFFGSMLLLVLASNPIIMFVGWELVGLTSYLLIGFYFKDYNNVSAANKAFIVNRIGDFGFIIALSTLFIALGETGFSFSEIEANILNIDNTTLTIIGVFLFVGAMGKSAQIPLYVWLPDAMAGPTPVSALIHAATMVTAGVYMVARFGFLYNEIPNVGHFIAIVGISSALLAAVIASYQNDIKKILAYSTISQLGYMFVAVGLGAYSFGIFHVFTHAFFKALLFMGAGAIIIALNHEQNIFKMRGLKDKLPKVFFPMLIATLAISGIPPFAGFFSKDAILNYAFANGNLNIWFLGLATAVLTSFYMFRMMFIVFYGNVKHNNLKKVDNTMLYPLYILAFGSIFVGFLGVNESYGGGDIFSNFVSLPEHIHHLSHSTEYILGLVNIFVAIIGIFWASRSFNNIKVEQIKEEFGFEKLVINKFYIDEFYNWLIVQKLRHLSLLLVWFDNKIIDGFINLLVGTYLLVGKKFANFQDGNIRRYAIFIIGSISLLSIALFIILQGR